MLDYAGLPLIMPTNMLQNALGIGGLIQKSRLCFSGLQALC